MNKILCWLFSHSKIIKFETTQPDGIIKETITCSRCDFEKVIYWV